MRKSFPAGRLLGTIGGLLLAAAAGAAESGLASVDARWMAAMKANNLEAVVACYAPNAVMWLPDAPEARGEKAIRESYKGFLAEWTVKDVGVGNTHYELAGDLSAGWGNFTLTLEPKAGGEAFVMKGRFTAVARRINDRWLYVADLASEEPPAQEAEAEP